MKHSFLVVSLCLFLTFQPQHVLADEDSAGSCSADSSSVKEGGETCASSSLTDQGNQAQICFPDGNCFASNEEAEAKYAAKAHYVPLDKPVNYGEPQQVAGPQWMLSMEVVSKTNEYMENVFKNDTAISYRNDCKARHELCAYWAALGECKNNPKYMLLHCAPVCQTCHEISFEHRCPFDKDAPTIWQQGDLNKMFERITTEQYYIDKFQPTVLSSDPWIVTLENVATKEECERMIKLGADRGYERSKDVGEKNWDGTFKSLEQNTRTSSNTWCLDECYADELHQSVLRRVENITDIPDSNSEYWQFLQYEVGQFYAAHHDYIPFHLERAQGVRILTVFLYLSDVEEGGGTHFNSQNITIQPKMGRAVIWPSVLDKDPNRKDFRTGHEALPVIKGVKYAANAWIHQRNFKKPFDVGCS